MGKADLEAHTQEYEMTPASQAPFNITVPNVNHALPEFLHWLRYTGQEEHTRNGVVLVAPGPVATTYLYPEQRVLWNPHRDCNHFFHFFESIWMLGGRQDVAFLEQFVPRMAEFSDDGETLNGAYGWRWAHEWGEDQLMAIVDMLRTNPTTRRAVLTMWNPVQDLIENAGSKDLPCNTHIYFRVNNGKLNMTVCNRSNDMLWGGYGANVVHMSMMQEFISSATGIPMGVYTQFSNNAHVYTERIDPRINEQLDKYSFTNDIYNALDGPMSTVLPSKMFTLTTDSNRFFEDCHQFFLWWDTWLRLYNPDQDFVAKLPAVVDDLLLLLHTHYFRTVVVPLYFAWYCRKFPNYSRAYMVCVQSDDWRLAGMQWLSRHYGGLEHG